MRQDNGQIREISLKAGDFFGNGFHCAEAVARAVIEGQGEDGTSAAAHATAFGGGFGKCFDEACGALSGALIAIGHFHGRTEPGADWEVPARMGAMVRDAFIRRWGTTHCRTLRDGFGEERQMDECRRIVEETVLDLLDVLDDEKAGR